MQSLQNITEFLNTQENLSPQTLDTLFDSLYPEVKKIANSQLGKIMKTSDVTPTLLVNECYLKLKNSTQIGLKNRRHFFSLVARCMRFYLIDMIRQQYTDKNRGDETSFSATKISTEDSGDIDLLELTEALEKLENIDEDLLRIVDMRFFGGFSIEEIAEVLESNKTKIYRQWLLAKSTLITLMAENTI